MEPVEKKYRERFKDQALSGDDFDSNGLWDAVSADLDAAAPTQRRRWFQWFYFAIFATVLLGLMLLIWPKGEATSSLTQTMQQEQSVAKEPAITSTANFKHTTDLAVKEEAIADKQAAIATQTALTTNPVQQELQRVEPASANTNLATNMDQGLTAAERASATNIKSEITATDQRLTKSTSTAASAELDKPKTETTRTIPAADVNVSNNSNGNVVAADALLVAAEEEQQSNVISPAFVEQLPLVAAETEDNTALSTIVETTASAINRQAAVMALANLPTKYLSYDWAFDAETELAEKRVEPLKSTQWLVGASGGVSLLRPTFSSTSDSEWATIKNQTETADWGYHFGLNTTLVWRKHTLLQAGLEYEQAHTTFSHEYSYDTLLVMDNVLLGVIVDSITGMVVDEIFGDTTVMGTVTRKLIQDNHYNSLSLPLSLGRQWTRGKWQYGLSVGVVLRFQLQQRGQTLSPEEEVITFSGNETQVLFPKVGLGVRVSPFLGYRLGKGLLLTASPRWTVQQNTIFGQADRKVRTQGFGLQLGVRKSLGRH